MSSMTGAAQSCLVVVGASAGGVEALFSLAASLPANFPAPVCIVQHVGANPSLLPELLRARGPNAAVHARDGMRLAPGTLFIAPPDYHLLVDGNTLSLSHGPRENHTRPAIDPLFRSAALHWGSHAVGVVLSGSMDDGTAGLAAIKECGGTAIVQDPRTALDPGMPSSALENVDVDHCVPVQEIGPLLARVVASPPPAEAPPPQALAREVAINRGEHVVENLAAIAEPSSLTCPDCGGSLWEVNDPRPLRYRCHTGHAFTAKALESAQRDTGEHALWSAARALQEREMLVLRMAAISEATGDAVQAQAGRDHAKALRERIEALVSLAESERP
jgi:two-component system chemotaxis response regulator CheB